MHVFYVKSVLSPGRQCPAIIPALYHNCIHYFLVYKLLLSATLPCQTTSLGPEGTHCPAADYQGVLTSGVEDVLWQSIGNHLVPVVCVHIIEGCLQVGGPDYMQGSVIARSQHRP